MKSKQAELSRIYYRRFHRTATYRNEVWKVLTREFFRKWVDQDNRVLDLGCGYGEFINNIVARDKWAMDLNPDARRHLNPEVRFIHQDCAAPWQVPEESLDTVFTSNFFEHLPDKESLSRALRQIMLRLRPGGRIIALGPNIKYLHGKYWDFYDHNVYLTETSLGEALEIEGFDLELVEPRFLPYTLVKAPEYPMFFVRSYIRLPYLWRILGKQFLLVARKPPAAV